MMLRNAYLSRSSSRRCSFSSARLLRSASTRAPQLERLRDHRGDDAVELERTLVVAILLVGEHHLERAPGPPPDGDRHGEVGELAAARALAGGRRQRRLLAGARHHHRLAGVDDPFGDAVAWPHPRPLRAEARADRGLDVQLARVRVEQEDRAAGHLMPALEQVEHRLQRRLEVEYARQRLTDFEKGRKPADFVGMVAAGADARVGH